MDKQKSADEVPALPPTKPQETQRPFPGPGSGRVQALGRLLELLTRHPGRSILIIDMKGDQIA